MDSTEVKLKKDIQIEWILVTRQKGKQIAIFIHNVDELDELDSNH